MVKSDPRLHLPTSAELPCSDDIPVDNEDQNFIPNFLLFLLEFIWTTRNDWFFGVDMAVYHTTGVSPQVPVVPDGFLSLGVERRKGGRSRRSYVVWEEDGIVPIFVLEIVSVRAGLTDLTVGNIDNTDKPAPTGGEYDTKAVTYAKLGVLYYVVYNPDYWQRDRHQPFEVYRLVDGTYRLQIGEPFWMPEIGLGIGRSLRVSGDVQREALYWYDEQGNRYLASDEAEQQARQQLEIERQQRESAQQQLEQYRRLFGELPED